MLHVGLAKVDITPALGIRLGGYGVAERPAEAIHDRLYATAAVFKQDGVIAAHVTVDVAIIMHDDMQRARELAEQSSGIPASQINIGASHTHSAPQTFTFHGWGVKMKPTSMTWCRKSPRPSRKHTTPASPPEWASPHAKPWWVSAGAP